MSLTQDEIKALAIEHKLIDGYDGDGLVSIDNRLVAYTAAVEAKERERCLYVAEKYTLGLSTDGHNISHMLRNFK